MTKDFPIMFDARCNWVISSVWHRIFKPGFTLHAVYWFVNYGDIEKQRKAELIWLNM